jgi:DNA invertase Pin-like site-specific DNA recombinase
MKPAFSYIRFSSPEQMKGDSFRRQSEKAEAWAKANSYTIVKAWKDLGVSGYHGKNALTGDYGEFLRAARAGELPKDSVLLVENLDRVSRQTPRKALSQFLEVIDLGIGLVTLTDNEWFTAQSLDDDASGMKLFASLMVMIRANNESRVKGERVAAAWSRKRAVAREKAVPLSDRIPGWLIVRRDEAGRRTFEENKRRADIVRRIFAETEQGFGRRQIVKGLNREGNLSFLSGKGWQPSSVIKIIRARTTIGEYQPHRRDETGRRVADGEPIKGYYPAVIQEAQWIAANAAVDLRRSNAAGRPHAEVANLVRGLARCGACGERMLFLNKGQPPKGGRYHVCSAASRAAQECDNKRLWRADHVERYVLHQIDPALVAAAFEPATTRPPPSPRTYDLQIAELTAMADAAIEASLRHAGKPLGRKMEEQAASLEEKIEDLRRVRAAAAAAQRSKPDLPRTQSAIATVAALAAKLDDSSAAQRTALRTSIVQQLRTAYFEIAFRPHAVVGLIELPEKPRTGKTGFGRLPQPIEVRGVKGAERYFLRHRFFSDDPDELADLGGGRGILSPRFV